MTAQVLLIVALLGSGNPREYPMPDMAACERAIATSKVVIPNGDENERGAVMYCVFEEWRPGWLGRLDAWRKN